MTPKEMQQNSAKKVQQALDLMQTLHLRVEARQKIDAKTGFIELTVFWIDDENYPVADNQKTLPLAPGETGTNVEITAESLQRESIELWKQSAESKDNSLVERANELVRKHNSLFPASAPLGEYGLYV